MMYRYDFTIEIALLNKLKKHNGTRTLPRYEGASSPLNHEK